MTVEAIILAAGASHRFGSANKLAANINDKPILRHVIDAAALADLDGIVLITRPQSTIDAATEATKPAPAIDTSPCRTITNPDAATGMASSITIAIKNLKPTTTGALILLADMPFIDTGLINQVITTFKKSRDTAIVIPENSSGRRGHPVLFPKDLFPELLELTGDRGAMSVIKRHPNRVVPLRTDTDAIFKDIDTQQDLAN